MRTFQDPYLHKRGVMNMRYVFGPRAATVVLVMAVAAIAQDGEFYPGQKLIIDGIPKIPASLAKTVAKYRNNLADSLLGPYIRPQLRQLLGMLPQPRDRPASCWEPTTPFVSSRGLARRY